MIFSIFGTDDYQRQKRKKQILAEHAHREFLQIDMDSFHPAEFSQACRQSGLFFSEKVILLEDVLGKALPKEEAEEIISLMEKCDNSVFLFFVQRGNPQHTLTKFLQKNGKIELCEDLSASQIFSWIEKKAADLGGKISKNAASLLFAFIGNDLFALENEIHKLVHYASERSIEEADIKNLVKAKLDEDIFRLMDAVSARNNKVIQKLLEEQFELGASVHYISTMLIRQFRIFLQIKSALLQKQTEIPGVHPYVFKKSVSYTHNFQPEQLSLIYRKLLDLDKKFKSSDPSVHNIFLTLFLASISK